MRHQDGFVQKPDGLPSGTSRGRLSQTELSELLLEVADCRKRETTVGKEIFSNMCNLLRGDKLF